MSSLVVPVALVLTACTSGTPDSSRPSRAPTSDRAASLTTLPVVPTASQAPLTARIVLSAQTITAGASVTGHVIVQNNTGDAVSTTGCGSPFQVLLGNEEIQPQSAPWRACLQTFTFPVGESSYPVAVAAFYLTCSSSSVPPCGVDGHPAPLPPGDYHTLLFTSTASLFPAPPPLAVRVTT